MTLKHMEWRRCIITIKSQMNFINMEVISKVVENENL